MLVIDVMQKLSHQVFMELARRNDFCSHIRRVLLGRNDDCHRVVWCDLSGRELEWFDCWVACGCTFEQREEHTRGLRGTDLDCITDVANFRTAMTLSPSLSRHRPDNHALSAEDWTGLVRLLFPPVQQYQLP